MKSFLIVVAFSLFLSVEIYSQARVTASLPEISGNIKNLEFTGWMEDHAGQWRSAPKKIQSKYWDIDGDRELGWDNIVSLKYYPVIFENNEFIVLEIIKRTRQYRTTGVPSSAYITNRGYYYVFEKNNFQLSIAPNQACVNNLILYSSFNTISPLTDSNRMANLLEFLKDSKILLTRQSRNGIQTPRTLGIPTFYYIEDEVVRFFINGEPTGDMRGLVSLRPFDLYDTIQEDFYYECPYADFINFFSGQ
jgi:hypothetical protein